jgi:ribosomal protein S18 acetylase RimI-like enzyme
MSIEYALERFPLCVRLKTGAECTIRPLNGRDDARLQKFFQAVPEVERLFIKKRPTERRVVRDWCLKSDLEKNFVLLMLQGGEIVGEATLHQRQGGWKRHIGVVTVLTHPEYRGLNVAKVLVNEIIHAARHLGLARLEAELNGERTVAIRALEQLGFNQLFRLPDYVLDMESQPHDYVVMTMNLRVEEEYAGVG